VLLGAPLAGMPADNFSTVWDGYVVPPCSGDYTFYTLAVRYFSLLSLSAFTNSKTDDGNNLYLYYFTIISDWNVHDEPQEDTSSTFTFTANTIYPISLEFFSDEGNAMV
jgi:hypothetical protein